MMTEEQACHFATDWIESWNAHDIDRIMSHYDENVEYSSMFLAQLTENTLGKLQGKGSLKSYFEKGLSAYPNLNFKLLGIFIGVASVTVQYESVKNLIAAEVFELNEHGLVVRVQCHYKQG
ncbi:MAG: nuclear transport factor 2 family protein [Cyanobacteria bacterium J06633_2]